MSQSCLFRGSADRTALHHGWPEAETALDTTDTADADSRDDGLLCAYAGDCLDLTTEDRRWLASCGVAEAALGFDAQRGLFKVRRASVTFVAPARFEFAAYAPDGRPHEALIFACRNHLGDLIDLAAWDKASRLTSWLGRVAALGQDNLYAPRLDGPLLIHASALEWLQHDREGFVIIDSRQARPLLQAAAGLIAVSDADFGLRLRETLTTRSPAIVVAQDGGSAP